MIKKFKFKWAYPFVKGLVLSLFLCGYSPVCINASDILEKSILGVKLITLSKDPLPQEDFLGHFTIIYVFATWCPTCHKSIPALKELGIPVYGLSYKSKNELTKHWVKKHEAKWGKVLWDPSGKRTESLGIKAVPQTYLIDPNGKIIFHHQGVIRDRHVSQMKLLLGNDKKKSEMYNSSAGG